MIDKFNKKDGVYMKYSIYICSVKKEQQETHNEMKPEILTLLKENRNNVEEAYGKSFEHICRLGSAPSLSKREYFDVVFNYFEAAGKIKEGRMLKSMASFYRYLSEAIEQADRAMGAQFRRDNFRDHCAEMNAKHLIDNQ